MYITRKDALEIISRMQNFELSLKKVFSDYEYDLHENLGRRNMLLSNAQEKETAKVLRKRFNQVESDGAPGKPDVVIHDINKELECKLTSGSLSKGSVSYSLQTDWSTLKNKGKLDYNYIIANDDFTEFCYIFFEGLTIDDFFAPAKAARGKARMNKAVAMKKAKFIVGGVVDNSIEHIENIKKEIDEKIKERDARLNDLAVQIENLTAPKQIENKKRIYQNEVKRYQKSLDKLEKRLSHWVDNPNFSFTFEKVGQEEKTVKKDSTLSKIKSFGLRLISNYRSLYVA